jgi:hypothetical protein
MVKHESLVAIVQQMAAEFDTFIAGLSEAEKEAAGSFETWSVKDTLAHVAVWVGRMADTLEGVRRGENPPDVEDFEHENVAIFESHKSTSFTQVIDLMAAAYRRLEAGIALIPEPEMFEAGRLPWLPENRPLWRDVVGSAVAHPLLHLTPMYVDQGNPRAGLRVQDSMTVAMQALSDDPSWQGLLAYNMACFYAVTGDQAEALDILRMALKLAPELVEWSRQDPDLVSLHGHPIFQALYDL